MEHGHPIGHCHRLRLIMSDIDHGNTDLAVNSFDLNLHLFPQVLVERAERLIQQQNVRIEDETARERNALLLTARKFPRIPVGEFAETHEVKNFSSTRLNLAPRESSHLERKNHILPHRHVRKKGIILKDHADVPLIGFA